MPIVLFVATGGIGENYTGNAFVYPQFLLIILVWLVGAIFSYIKKFTKLGLIISALPPLYFILKILFAILDIYI